jgi:hypothetical protein
MPVPKSNSPAFERTRVAAALLTALSFLAAGGRLAAEQPPRDAPPAPGDVLGVTHVAGTYHLTDRNFLEEGAHQLAQLGVGVIKLYLNRPAHNYPFHADWPETKSLVDVCQTPAYRSVFAGPFSTYLLTVYAVGRGDHYWIGGISDDQAADETEQFYQLSRYLLNTYRGTGKTFVLQHWEGDWAARGSYDRNADPTPEAFARMIHWLNARQAGVDRARAACGQDGVRVLHAAEVNLVRMAMEDGRPTVTDRVLPFTKVDLVSYSAWDTQQEPALLRRALDYIARHTPDRSPFGNRNVYIGEFGLPENDRSPDDVLRVSSGVIDTALDWGCPYIVYWQLYCNEARRDPVRGNDDVRGFWLLRPDGSRSVMWDELTRRLGD